MKRISPVLALCFLTVAFQTILAQPVSSLPEEVQEDSDTLSSELSAQDYADRSRRLREFGYPLLAQSQLDNGLSLDPTSRPLLIEYLRLFDANTGDGSAATKYLDTLLKLYPDDYTACFEISKLLFQLQPLPVPPDTSNPEKLAAGLKRLEEEMEVYSTLGKFIIKPDAELPSCATGRPRLSLAFLARAEKASPRTFDVALLSARELDFLGRSFQRWAQIDPKLQPFGDAAQKLYTLCLPLYRRASGKKEFAAEANIQIANLLYRMGKIDDAKKAIIGAEFLASKNLRLANTKVAIANDTTDIELLIEALGKRHQIFNDVFSALDSSVAIRIKDKEWPYRRWLEYQTVVKLYGREKTLAAKALLNDEPDLTEVHYLLADELMSNAFAADQQVDRVKLIRLAIGQLDACKGLADKLADWHRLRALGLWELGDYKNAEKAYRATAAADPTDRDAVAYAQASADIQAKLYSATDYHIYIAQLQPGNFKNKREALLAVIARAPKFLAAQKVLGKVCIFIGDFATAFIAYRVANELEPDNSELLDGLARSAMEINRFADSLKFFKELQKIKQSDDHLRWISLLEDLVSGTKQRQLAFVSWRESTRGTISESGKKTNLNTALAHDPIFPEACIDLAVLVRRTRPDHARSLLTTALKNARDGFVRAAAHRELGRLYAYTKVYGKAVNEFLSAYDAYKADGTDLLLAAMAYLKLEDHNAASAAMHRLFTEMPNSPLLRPHPSDLLELNLMPKANTGSKRIHPSYSVGDKIGFNAIIDVFNEGGGLDGKAEPFEIGVNLEFKATPINGGIWEINVSFNDIPTVDFKALSVLDFTLKISPWFGLADAPVIGGELQSIIDPIVQAITEGFTVGLGDLPLQSPQVWKNDLTLGPAHFGGEGVVEAAALTQSLGDSFVLVRRAGAGKRIGDANSEFTRTIEAKVEISGTQRHIQFVSFEINKKELTHDRDDVVHSRLKVTLKAK